MRAHIRRLSFLSAGMTAMVLIAGCGGKVPAPKSYAKYGSQDGSFACKYPKGWDAQGAAGKNDSASAWATFTKGGAEIKVTTDVVGSLFADIARAGSMNNPDAEPPVAGIHERTKRIVEEDFSNYKEKAAKKVNTVGLGEARYSEFAASGGFGAKVRGYRATALSNDKRIILVAHCPASEFKTLAPAFRKVIQSLSR